MISGDLNMDLSEKKIEILSKVLIESNRTLFSRSFLFLLVFELGGVVKFLTPLTMAKVAEAAIGARVKKKSDLACFYPPGTMGVRTSRTLGVQGAGVLRDSPVGI